MSYTINNLNRPGMIRRPVKFGQQASGAPMKNLAQNGVWITTERLPAKVGGLGEVSKTIPESIAEQMPEKDVRIVVPYLKQHRAADESKPGEAFKTTGVQFNLPMADQRIAKVDVLERFEPATGHEKEANPPGNWVYALRNDQYFMAKDKTGEEQGLAAYTYNPEAGEFDKVMLYNRAAAKLVPLLDGNSADPQAQKLHRFNNAKKQANPLQAAESVKTEGDKAINRDAKGIDFVVAHDWLSGPVLNELPDLPKTKKIFMVHNKYDKVQIPEVAQNAGLSIPKRLYDREENFSALRMGLEPADAVIVNDNFLNTILDTNLVSGEPMGEVLRKKSKARRTFNMHHGLSTDTTASGSQAPACFNEKYQTWVEAQNKALKKLKLNEKKNKKDIDKINLQLRDVKANLAVLPAGKQDYEFVKMEVAPNGQPSAEQMETFKAANKAALQKKLGLKQDPDAILMSWAARLEPRQKGFFLFQKAVEETLANNPKVQFVVVGDSADKAVVDWIDHINVKYNGQVEEDLKNEKGEVVNDEKGQPIKVKVVKNHGGRRIYMPNLFANQDEIKQINAASDFTILPSLYEPYGLTHLEAMKMGSIPIVHGVDGLKTTVKDPEFLKLLPEQARASWQNEPMTYNNKHLKFEQNGILMEPVDIDQYGEFVEKRMAFESLDNHYQKLAKGGEDYEKEFKAFLKDMQEGENYRLHSAKLAIHKIETRPLNQAEQKQLQQRAENLRKEAAEIKALRQKISRAGQVDPEVYEKEVQKYFFPDDTYNNQESQKLIKAMSRGIELMGKSDERASGGERKDTAIRLQALNYVNVQHAWKTLVNQYYKPVFEESTLDMPARQRHMAEMAAAQEALKPAQAQPPEHNQKRYSKPVELGIGQQISRFWNSMWNWNQKFWASIGRFFSWRKD